jgi:L-amino acid N-acyltransferase YncA
MLVRDATPDDWPAIWRFMRAIVEAGETFSWDRDLAEPAARERWMAGPPLRTLVAVDDDGTVVGTAVTGPNHGGGAAHIATASFMVDPQHARRGIGRALGEAVFAHAREAGFRAMQFNAVVQTNVGAVALWRALGMEILATIPEGFRHPTRGYVGLHIMFQPLAPAAGRARAAVLSG